MEPTVFDTWYYTEKEAGRKAEALKKKGYSVKINRSKNYNRDKHGKLIGGRYIFDVFRTSKAVRTVVKVTSHGDVSVEKNRGKCTMTTTGKPTVTVSTAKFTSKETAPRLSSSRNSSRRRGIDLGAGVVRDRRGRHIPLE